MSETEPNILFGDFGHGEASAALASLAFSQSATSSSSSNVEPFPGFGEFFGKVALENAKRSMQNPLLTPSGLKELCENLSVFSMSGLYLLAKPEPEGFANAVRSAEPPCDCFASLSAMDRRVFLTIISDHQAAKIGATSPPVGFGMVSSGTGATASASAIAAANGTTAHTEDSGKSHGTIKFIDRDGTTRVSLSDKALVVQNSMTGMWRCADPEKISDYVGSGTLILDPERVKGVFHANWLKYRTSLELPLHWSDAGLYPRLAKMEAFSNPVLFGRLLTLDFHPSDMNLLNLGHFYTGGSNPLCIVDPTTVDVHFKLMLQHCLEGFLLAMQFVFSKKFATAENVMITSGLKVGFGCMHRVADAWLLVQFHAVLAEFSRIVREKESTVVRELSGPQHTVRLLIGLFTPLTASKWTMPSESDNQTFACDLFPTYTFPGQTVKPKRKIDPTPAASGSGSTGSPVRKSRFRPSQQERAERRAAAAATTASSAGAASQASGLPSSMNSLSLGGSTSTAIRPVGSLTGAAGYKRLCVAHLCHLVGVNDASGAVMKCSPRAGTTCTFFHAARVEDPLPAAAIEVLRLVSKSGPKPWIDKAIEIYSKRV
jgi:hypothetical protein